LKKKLKKKLDQAVRLRVIDRDGGICQRCGKAGNQVSHVISRRNLNLRWDMTNLKLMCVGCHIYWWHKSPLEAVDWFKGKFPDRYDYVMKNKNVIKQWSVTELEELLEGVKDGRKTYV